jgi:hypothetical protein
MLYYLLLIISIIRVYIKYTLGLIKRPALKAFKANKKKGKKANKLSITLVYIKLILSNYYR